jgi:hypothetical protein
VSGVFARAVIATVLTIFATVALGELPQSTAAPAAEHSGATITYQFERTVPGVSVPRYTVVLHEDGSGTYHAEEVERRSADSALQQVSTKIIDRPMMVSPEMTAKIFKTARELNRFNVFCGTKAKNLADTGKKTMNYAGSDGTGSCTYNYSDDKNVMDLTDLFYGIVYTMDVGRKLDFERRFDRLGLDAEMIALEQAVKDKHALELGNIAPTLQRLASDPAMMQRVQTRAAKLLVMATDGK